MSLSSEAIFEIEHLHSRWLALEIAGDTQQLITLCDPSIEIRPPSTSPIRGHAAVSAYLALTMTRIQTIEVVDRFIDGSAQLASLTARFTTTFSTPEDQTSRQISGRHRWLLARHHAGWLVTAISWSI